MYLKLVTFLRCLKSWFFGLLRFTHNLFARTWFRRINSSLRSTKHISMESDDDCDCEFDSTWEDEDENKTPNEKLKKSRRNMYAAKDMQDFRHRCLELDDDYEEDYTMEKEDDAFQINPLYHLKFYRGEIKAAPVAIHIDGFHKDWWGQYDLLEKAHYYIQWLFPIQRKVNNWRIHCLRKKEIMLFRRDEDVKHKLIKSYKVMLDFYGIRLADEKTGKVERAENWKQRFNNLNRFILSYLSCKMHLLFRPGINMHFHQSLQV